MQFAIGLACQWAFLVLLDLLEWWFLKPIIFLQFLVSMCWNYSSDQAPHATSGVAKYMISEREKPDSFRALTWGFSTLVSFLQIHEVCCLILFGVSLYSLPLVLESVYSRYLTLSTIPIRLTYINLFKLETPLRIYNFFTLSSKPKRFLPRFLS